ncbi:MULTISPECIES: molybdopterin-synthase adenylyltransferase MoeB [Halobacterium]|uniref:Molybdenum cofactor biosynthesis protein n=4 Tax=Halobacterium salinarum TaxID=2242 RepID=Q9HST5_HALSA|nr:MULTISPECIES: molybdopterin-synthase adenylyltransferase MoeB [Halobacterium]AAG18717.1 molybdenum cofactor biosynthesis protein [Halobacterium salinarum NRC-1]MBB6090928.1 adenylyltransferase/sulfurtransferase [Halobacterium salinarum]MCF2164680.1 molybdopterin-synthase adenylyltransferase MoeB [Halobacterium salinarum]MCF2166874.1 molybdopterin-synthase adenylyltransferase MoeB [Halobacterium salinarum]MCF2206146.1 molybdopterin-synthase adenylyltransferase MoeB [Halobacterium salinarum]
MSGLELDATQLDRYSRHIIMDDVGATGQAALREAAVLVVGAGGLGSPVIQYLAAAGVGTIGIADDDAVELSNLQRQTIHGTDDVGEQKVDSAAAFVDTLNPDVDVQRHDQRVTADTVTDLIAAYDVVVDASDNFRTRYLINDACTLAGVPFSHGAIFQFEGQVTTFTGGDDGPCYRCLFPEAPPAGTVPDCATAGVLGVLPGTIGSIQATETVKHILGVGDSLDGRLLFYDAADMSFETVALAQRPECPICGDSPVVDSVQEVAYTESCAVTGDATTE